MTDGIATTQLEFPRLLDELHHDVMPDGLVASAAGVVLASTTALRPSDDHPLHRFGLAVGGADPSMARPDPRARERFAAGLVDLHLRLLRAVLAHALSHLDNRTSEGATLLARQQVQAELADVATDIWECSTLAELTQSSRARWQTHLRMVATGRALLRLFGASGFLADGPGRELHLAELAGNVYLHPEVSHDQRP
ncbi:MAG: acyl-CoA dehydrogenase family protein [Stackebrandtia sp.]